MGLNKVQETEMAQQYVSSCILSILAMSKRAASKLSTQDAAIKDFQNIIDTIENTEGYFQAAFGNYHFEETKRIKKGFRIVKNHCLSLISMYETNDVSRKDLIEFSDKQESRCSKLNSLILSVSKKVLEKRSQASAKEIESSDELPASPEINSEGSKVKVIAGKSIGDIITEVGTNYDKVVKECQAIIQKYEKNSVSGGVSETEYLNAREKLEKALILKDMEKFTTKMPTSADKKKPFIVARLPIIPRLSNVLTEKELQDAGFKTKMFAKYPVLQDQLVVGENTNVLAQTVIQKIKDPKTRKKTEILVKNNPYMPNVQEVIEAIQQKTKKRIVVMTKVRPKEHGFNWYWLVPESQIMSLNRKNKHFHVLDWDFAFRT